MCCKYLWTQKAEDDYRRRHPGIREKDVLRRAGHEATYDGRPASTCGESILLAFRMRGWIEKETTRKAV